MIRWQHQLDLKCQSGHCILQQRPGYNQQCFSPVISCMRPQKAVQVAAMAVHRRNLQIDCAIDCMLSFQPDNAETIIIIIILYLLFPNNTRTLF